MSMAIGIDLGTTNTVVAAVVDGVAVTLEDDQKRRLIPSVVSFHPSGNVLVGDSARERRLIDPENTIYSVKRLIGRPWTSAEVQTSLRKLPFKIQEGAKSTTMIVARNVAYAVPEISAFVLRRAKAIAEAALGQPVDRAVITVPANFNDLQRASTKVAGKLAGLEVLRILNEPTAAALAYGQTIAEAERIAVYDLGGGTFDITLLDLSGSVFEVLATAGDSSLGGDDVDLLIADKIADEITQAHRFDPRTNYVSFGRLRLLAESIKRDLSASPEVSVDIKEIGYGDGGQPISYTFKMARAALEQIVEPLIRRTMEVAQTSIEVSGLKPGSFDRVLLVGGSTRMPMVTRRVEAFFGQAPHLRVNPDEVVALGAAIQAYSLSRAKNPHRKKEVAPVAVTMPSAASTNANTDPTKPINVAQTLAERPAPTASDATAPPQPRPKEESTLVSATNPAQSAAPQHLPAPSPQTLVASGNISAATPASQMQPSPLAPRTPVQPEQPNEMVRRALDAVRKRTPSTSDAENQKPNAGSPTRTGPQATQKMAAVQMPTSPSDFKPTKEALRGPSSPDLNDSIVPAVLFGSLPGAPRSQEAPDLDLKRRAPSVTDAKERTVEMENAPMAKGVVTRDVAALLIDVTPLSLRVETVGGFSDALIAANSPVPCDRTRVFLTATDNQTVVYIRVAQGEGARFMENTYLGELELSGLKGGARGEVQIAVTFELDADGILNVRAQDKTTGKQTVATLRLLGTTTDEGEVRAMMQRQARHNVV